MAKSIILKVTFIHETHYLRTFEIRKSKISNTNNIKIKLKTNANHIVKNNFE
jgi:hypothetical protein